jgi:protoporphyrinogen oxidase
MVGKRYKHCILGAGPAGLSVAYELMKNNEKDIIVIDKNNCVGGLSRTVEYEGNKFDIGPHRFFTKNIEVNDLWREVLGSDFQPVSRLTRIFYKNTFFHYPIKLFNVLSKLSILESIQIGFSFFYSKFSKKKVVSFEDYIVENFGKKLFNTFFKTYTEKVWGIACSKISSEWASQRIKDLSILSILRNIFKFSNKNSVKTLVEEFDYPIHGSGYMYEKMAEKLKEKHVEFLLGSEVVRINRNNQTILNVEIKNLKGETSVIEAQNFYSSLPLKKFFLMVSPSFCTKIAEANKALKFRSHICVNLIINRKTIFPDQWIYIHSPEVETARIANFNNFSKKMTKNPNSTLICVEFFTFFEDRVWLKTETELIDLAKKEVEILGLVKKEEVIKGFVVKEKYAYPVNDIYLKDNFPVLKSSIDSLDNFQPIGRAGLHKYNNQDHSIYSGLLAARNVLRNNKKAFKLWNINTDAKYQECCEK